MSGLSQTDASRRLDLVLSTIDRQKMYIARVPDPDNRSEAESNLLTLVQMKNDLEAIVRADTPE